MSYIEWKLSRLAGMWIWFFVSLNLILWYPLSFSIYMNEYKAKRKRPKSQYENKRKYHNTNIVMNEAYLFIWYHNFQVIKCMIISATSIKWYNHKYCSTIYVIKSFISRNRILLIFKGTKDKILSAIHILQVCVSKDQGKAIISLDIKFYIGK